MNNGAEDFHVLCVSLIYGFYTDDAGIYIRTSSIMIRFNTTGTGCVLYEMRYSFMVTARWYFGCRQVHVA